MNEVKNAVTATNEKSNTTVTNAATQAAYVKPAIEVIEMEMEGAILQASGEDGGRQNW